MTPKRIQQVRRQSKALVTIGACATAGRHPGAAQFRRRARSSSPPSTRAASTSRRWRPPRRSPPHVKVDFELRGCPINKHQLLEVMSAFLPAASRRSPAHSVCIECKLRGTAAYGGARHALPRPGHPCRLRRDLPRLQSRLLRLLRPDGKPEHGVAGGGMATARRDRTRHRIACSAPSTPAPRRSGRRATRMAAIETIKVDTARPRRRRGRARPADQATARVEDVRS